MAISIPVISDFDSKGTDRAIREFQKLETTGQKAGFAIKKAAAPAALALGVLADFAGDAVKAFMEDDKAAQILATSLKNTTGATDAQVASVEKFITQTSIAAAVSDDELRPALEKLVRGTGDVTKAQDLLSLALDISAGTGKDLGAVSDALSKAFNGNLGPLKKLDPALASLVENGASVDEVFAALGKTFSGQASTAANTTSGKMKNLGIQMGELKESIGAAVAPLVEKLLPTFLKFSSWARENTGLIVTLGIVIGGIATAVIATNAALAVYNAVQALTAVLNGGLTASNAALATSTGAVTVATTAATASFSALWVATGAVVILAIIAALVALQAKFNIFGKAIDGLKAGFMAWWGVVQFVFGAVKAGFGELADLGKAIFDGIGGAFKGVINAVISAMEKGLNFAIKGLNTILDGIDKAAGPWVNFGSIPEVKLPRLAEGGITTGPTIAMIGEKGPEAVIPLDRLGSMGGGMNITVNVTSANPNDVVSALQKWVRNNGQLALSSTSGVRF